MGNIHDLEKAKFVEAIAQVKVDLNSVPRIEVSYDGNGNISLLEYYDSKDVKFKETVLTYDGDNIIRIENTEL